jgi:hypothetical protein
LQVPEDFFGKTVQCPECKHAFQANPAGTTVNPGAPDPAPADDSPVREAPAWEKPPRPRDDDAGHDRRRPRPDDEQDEDDRPRRRRLAPHRGGMILAFGIMSLFIMPVIFGPLAWIMGHIDLQEMKAGRMDPSGESQTNTGRILGMVACILQIVGLVLGCGIAALFILAGILGGAAHHR